jgi:hypothetical protein
MSVKRCTCQLLKSLSNAIKDSGSQLFCQRYQKRELVFRHRQFSTARASHMSVSSVRSYKLTFRTKLLVAGASRSKRDVMLVQPMSVRNSKTQKFMSALCNIRVVQASRYYDVALSSSMLAH